MPSTSSASTRRSPGSAERERVTVEIDDPDDLGGYGCRWYDHNGGRPVQFATMAEVAAYMARHGIGRPDELLVPIGAD